MTGPRRAKPRNAEYQIHIAITDLLRKTCMPGVIFWHTENERKRTPAQSAAFKAMGGRAGVPDLIISMPDGTMAFVEIKAARGRTSEVQWEFLLDMNVRGHWTCEVRTIEQAVEFLTDCGAIRASKVTA